MLETLACEILRLITDWVVKSWRVYLPRYLGSLFDPGSLTACQLPPAHLRALSRVSSTLYSVLVPGPIQKIPYTDR